MDIASKVYFVFLLGYQKYLFFIFFDSFKNSEFNFNIDFYFLDMKYFSDNYLILNCFNILIGPIIYFFDNNNYY